MGERRVWGRAAAAAAVVFLGRDPMPAEPELDGPVRRFDLIWTSYIYIYIVGS
jgi:hypothetical protein